MTKENSICQRCSAVAETKLHTAFGLETLCLGCRDAVRQDGQEIAAPYPLNLEDYAAYKSWREFVRLSVFCLDMRAALKYRMSQARRNEWLLSDGKRTEWTGMVERWHKKYLEVA